MARIRGDDGVVLVGANPVAAVREFTYNEDGDEIPVPAMGDTAQETLPSLPKVAGTLRCWYDSADTTGQGALLQGATITLELRPEGTGSGLPEITVTNAKIISENIRQAQGGGVEKDINWTAPAIGDRTAQA